MFKTSLLEEHMEFFNQLEEEYASRADGCMCRPEMTNAGTNGMFISDDTQGCPLHCTHKDINTNGEWWCLCGASHEREL